MSELTPQQLEDEIRTRANKFRGRMAGLIESFGLPERQERGAIATLKSLSYDHENHLVDLINPKPSGE